MALDHLRLADLSDREVLLILEDCADADGYADPMDMAERLGVSGEHPRRIVSARLAWLRRFGAVDREREVDERGRPLYVEHRAGTKTPRYTQRYRMTTIGHALASGQMRKTQERALEGMRDGEMLQLTQWLTRRARTSGGTVQKLVQREWRYRTEFHPNGSQ